MLIGFIEFLLILASYRVLWLNGRPGGGKTILAFTLALECLRQSAITGVKEIFSNVPGVGLFPERGMMASEAVYIADEGGIFWQNQDDYKETAAALRKQKIILILPSVINPSYEFCALSVQRVINFTPVLQIPLWGYKWSLRYNNIRQGGEFWWLGQMSSFGVYNSAEFPSDDAGISEFISDNRNNNFTHSFRRYVSDAQIAMAQKNKSASNREAVPGSKDGTRGMVGYDEVPDREEIKNAERALASLRQTKGELDTISQEMLQLLAETDRRGKKRR